MDRRRSTAGALVDGAGGNRGSVGSIRSRPTIPHMTSTGLTAKLASVLDSRVYEVALTTVITINLLVVIVETDHRAECEANGDPVCRTHAVVDTCNVILLVVYCLELTLKLFIYRNRFGKDFWNLFDMSLVTISVLAEVLGNLLPGVSILRILRLARLGKLLHAMVRFPALYMIVHGFLSAMVSIFWASFLLLFFLTLWSIVAVIAIHPLMLELLMEKPYYFDGCRDCADAFSSVWRANLTFFQTLIAGDSWGKYCTPILEEHPWTTVFFGAMLMSVSLGICNLILAVIVENAASAREEDGAFQTQLKQQTELRNHSALLRVCKAIDKDESGTLSADEIMKAYEEHDDFRSTCLMMRIEGEDLQTLFEYVDADGSGDIDYMEMTRMLVKMKSLDVRTMLMLLKMELQNMNLTIRELRRGTVKPPRSSSWLAASLAQARRNASQASLASASESGAGQELARSLPLANEDDQPAPCEQQSQAATVEHPPVNGIIVAEEVKCDGLWQPLPLPPLPVVPSSVPEESCCATAAPERSPEGIDKAPKAQMEDYEHESDSCILEEHNFKMESRIRLETVHQEQDFCDILERMREDLEALCKAQKYRLQHTLQGVAKRTGPRLKDLDNVQLSFV